MKNPETRKAGWKQRLSHEFIEYGINVCYLAIVFAAFTQYRRLLLAAHDITYTNYWFALIEAFILGKVIVIGDLIRLGRGFESKPLIFPTLYKTAVFTIFVAAFKILEHGIVALFRNGDFMAGLDEVFAKGQHEMLANTLMLFVALFPFFVIRELGRVFGQENVWTLFFQRNTGASVQPPAK
jgi:hypothetical protein